jgi:pimeloyl-ACP methyl ester carboxylesterase
MMRGRAVAPYAIIGLLIAAYPVTGYSYNASDIEQFLSYNRTLNGNPYRDSNGENIDKAFMTDVIRREIENFNKLIDDYDVPDNPSPGYTWDIKIYHPGEIPGTLPPEGGPYPIIIICKGATGSSPDLYRYMDWLASAYARKGYVVAIPQLIADTSGSPLGFTPITDIRADIYALQVSDTIDYLERKFSSAGLLNPDQTTVIGHSYGGYVVLRAASQDRRIARIGLLSAYFENYYELNTIDTYDTMRILNSLPEDEKPALHVQRYTLVNNGCPDVEPQCDPIPVIDGFLLNVSEDPWIPFYCNGKPCGERTGTFYNYHLYGGPKEDGIRNNPYLNHTGGNTELGHPEVIRLLDMFFETFPVSVASSSTTYTLVETRSTPGFDPPVFYLGQNGSCPVTYLLGANDDGVASMRRFRDRVLAGSTTGRRLVGLYYKYGENATALFASHPLCKNVARTIVGYLVPVLNLTEK